MAVQNRGPRILFAETKVLHSVILFACDGEQNRRVIRILVRQQYTCTLYLFVHTEIASNSVHIVNINLCSNSK
jgi:hypothetical protein